MISDYYSIAAGGEPSSEPLTLVEAKNWLRQDASDDDTIINALITSVTEIGEKFTGRYFVQRTVEGFFSGLDLSRSETVPFIEIRRSPLIAVSFVEVLSGGSYTAYTDYTLKRKHGYSRVLFTGNNPYSLLPDDNSVYPIKVTFTAGYGTADDVPEAIKTALKAHIAFLYENRGDVIAEGKIGMPLETKAIYSAKYRILREF